MKEKIMLLVFVLASIFLILFVLIIYINNSFPECYLTDEDNCIVGYDKTHNEPCYNQMTECCKKPHYMMQGVYGDYTCYYIYKKKLDCDYWCKGDYSQID